jgi:hypothetical protein
MAQAATGDQADTPIMHILIGIAGSGLAVTGVIGRARRDEGPQPERRNSTVILQPQTNHVGQASRLPYVFSGAGVIGGRCGSSESVGVMELWSDGVMLRIKSDCSRFSAG